MKELVERHVADEFTLIAVTGYGRKEDQAAAHRTSFNHHLVKPLEVSDLLAVLPARQEPTS